MPVPSVPKPITDLWMASLVALRWRTKSSMPPLYMYVTSRGASSRSSRMVIDRPRLRKAISCRRRDSVSNEYVTVSKIAGSAQNVTVLPCLRVGAPFTRGRAGCSGIPGST